MTVKAPPTEQQIVTDDSGFSSLPWVVFFNQMFNGDAGNAWTPLFSGLTAVGVPKVTGNVYQLSQYISFFRATITPATSITAVAGTTYINNFPLTMNGNGICFAVSGLLGGVAGMCDQKSNRIYIPGFTAVTVPLSIVGIVEAN